MHVPQGPSVSPAVLAAMLLVVAASCEVTLFESDAFMRSSRSDSTLNVLQDQTIATEVSQHTAATHEPMTTEKQMNSCSCGQQSIQCPRPNNHATALRLVKMKRPTAPVNAS